MRRASSTCLLSNNINDIWIDKLKCWAPIKLLNYWNSGCQFRWHRCCLIILRKKGIWCIVYFCSRVSNKFWEMEKSFFFFLVLPSVRCFWEGLAPKRPLTLDSRAPLLPAGIPKSLFYISNVCSACVDVLVGRAGFSIHNQPHVFRNAHCNNMCSVQFSFIFIAPLRAEEKNMCFYLCSSEAGMVDGKLFMIEIKRFI